MYNVQDYSFLFNNLFVQLYVRIGILLIFRKHLHDRIISQKERFGPIKLV